MVGAEDMPMVGGKPVPAFFFFLVGGRLALKNYTMEQNYNNCASWEVVVLWISEMPMEMQLQQEAQQEFPWEMMVGLSFGGKK